MDAFAAPAATTTRPTRSRASLLVQAALVVAVLLMWLLLFRWFVPHGDDFRHLGVGGQPDGQFDAAQWWDALVVDYALRNGRVADAAIRLLLGPLGALYWLLAPLLLTALSVVSAWWVTQDRRDGQAPLAWTLVGLTAPMAVFALRPSESGEAIFWGSGFANYALPLLCALGAALLVHRARDLALGWWLAPAVVVVLLAHVLHEQASFATLAMVAVVLGASRRRSRAALALGAVSVAGFLVNLLAPGIWRRLEEPQGPALPLVEGAARAADAFARTGRPFLCLLLVCVTLPTIGVLRADGGAARGRLLGLAALTWAGFVGLQAASLTADGALACGLEPGALGTAGAVALLGSATALGLGMFLWLLALVSSVGVGAPALWAGSLAALAIPMVTSRCAGRVLFDSLVLLGVVAVLALRAAVDGRGPGRGVTRSVPALAALTGVVLTVLWAVMALGGLRANAAEVRGFEASLADARAGDVLELPDVPDPRFAYARAFLLPRYGCEIALYYDVPEGVVLQAPDGETFDVTRPCLTGWDEWLQNVGHASAE